MGDRFEVTALKGDELDLSVPASRSRTRCNPLGAGQVTIARSAYDRSFTAERERYAFVSADGAVAAAARAGARGFPDVKLQSKASSRPTSPPGWTRSSGSSTSSSAWP